MTKAIKQFGIWMESMHEHDPELFSTLRSKYAQLFESTEDVVNRVRDKVGVELDNKIGDIDADIDLTDAELDLDTEFDDPDLVDELASLDRDLAGLEDL